MSEPKVFRNAVELDEFLTALTPEQREANRPKLNQAHQAQVRSAMADVVAERERRLGHKAHWVPHTGVPEWMRLGMLDVILRWNEGRVMTCSHQPNPNRPQPVYTAAWKPGVVVCAQCTPMLRVTGDADRTCDGCGHVCAGLPDDGICPVSAFATFVCYQVGVCVNCYDELVRVEKEAKGG